jgi:serine/threonine-protein kinase HipA
MRVGKEGADSSVSNALSECKQFGLTPLRATQLVEEVAAVVSAWQSHFSQAGLALQDVQTVAQHVDRAFLRNQRQPFL